MPCGMFTNTCRETTEMIEGEVIEIQIDRPVSGYDVYMYICLFVHLSADLYMNVYVLLCSCIITEVHAHPDACTFASIY
jgi:hypothetical protein